MALQVRSIRGDIEETVHDVLLVAARADGTVVFAQGDAEHGVLLRSAAKPFQAIPLFDGAAAHFNVTPEETALACASHNSEMQQVATVGGFLGRLGLGEEALVCGPHRSLIKDLGYFVRNGNAAPVELAKPSPLASNCSGKHTGMLAVALYNGWEPGSYWKPDHGVQLACRAALSQFCNVPEQRIGEAVDGCGVVCWSLPLGALARGYAKLVEPGDERARAIVAAMTQHPEFVAGQRRMCTALMGAFPGQIVAKVGAGGVYAAALVEQGIGIAIKVVDGNSVAAGVALLHVLQDLGLLEAPVERLADYAQPAILNTRRSVVGRYESKGGIT